MYLQVVSLSPSLFKIKTSVVHIFQSVYKGMLLPNSISPSLCTVCICTQHICVFVCPLIPNLNICPTSPHNIGPLARPCPLETAINSVLFSCQFSFTDLWQGSKIRSGLSLLWKYCWETVLPFRTNLLKHPNLLPSPHPLPWELKMLHMFKTDIYMPDCIQEGRYTETQIFKTATFQCTQNITTQMHVHLITVSDFGHKGTQCLCFKNENSELRSQTREERSSPCCVHRGGKSTSGGGAGQSQSHETQTQTQHRRKKLAQAETQ